MTTFTLNGEAQQCNDGLKLAEVLEKHLKTYAHDVLETKEGVRVTKVTQLKKADEAGGPLFRAEGDDGARQLMTCF